MDALLPSLVDGSDCQSDGQRDLPLLTRSSPRAVSLAKPSTPRTLTSAITNDWQGFFNDLEPPPELSNMVDPRDMVRCAKSTPTAYIEHSSFATSNGVNVVQVSGQGCQTSDREVSTQTRRRDWISEIAAYDQQQHNE